MEAVIPQSSPLRLLRQHLGLSELNTPVMSFPITAFMRMIAKPGVVVPHAGICEGAPGNRCPYLNRSESMQSIANSKVSGTVLVLLGFACWLAASAVIPDSSEWFFVATYSVGRLAFLLVGYLLPEYQDRREILCRRSALQLMAFFFWLAVNSLGRVGMIKDALESPSTGALILVPASLVIAFGSYFTAIYLIRGFRAPPCCAASKKEQPTESGPRD